MSFWQSVIGKFRQVVTGTRSSVFGVRVPYIPEVFGALQTWVSAIPERLLGWGTQASKQEAERFAEIVREAVYNQRYEWVSLSKRYLEWKIKKGRDPRILLATHEYVRAIEVEVVKEDKRKGSFRVGLPDRIHTDSGLPLKKLAAIHEFGVPSKQIPARPLWRPAWEQFRLEASKKIVRSITAQVLKDARRFQEEIKHLNAGVEVKVRVNRTST